MDKTFDLTTNADYGSLSAGLNAASGGPLDVNRDDQVTFVVSGTFTGASVKPYLKTRGGTWVPIGVVDKGANTAVAAGAITVVNSTTKLWAVRFPAGMFVDAKLELVGISTGTVNAEITSGKAPPGGEAIVVPTAAAATSFGAGITLTGGSGTNTITVPAALASAYNVSDGTNTGYIGVNSSTCSVALLGYSGGSTSVGGTITGTAGPGGSSSGAGGAVTWTGGAGVAGNAAGGAVGMVGGAGQGSATGGAGSLTGGAGGATGAGGAITLTSGAGGATSGAAGAINLAVGSATSANGASITLTAGSGAGGTNAGGHVNLVPGAAVSTGTPGEFRVNGDANMIFATESLSATDASRAVFVANRAMILKSVKAFFSTASTSGTLQVEKLTGTTAAGSGTNLLTGTVSLAGTANTVVSGTLIGTVASLTLAAGDRIGVVIAGTMTNLVNCKVTIGLAPL